MRLAPIVAAVLLAAACDREPAGTEIALNDQKSAAQVVAEPSAPRWDLIAQDGVTRLELRSAAGAETLMLRCAEGSRMLMVEVPGFRTIGSEDRLSFGSGGEVVAMVAAVTEHGRPGVIATTAAPANLAALLAGRVTASYGAQSSGPHPAPPAEAVQGFVRACGGREAVPVPPPPPPGSETGSPCRVQGQERLQGEALRAIGTEPFWGARIEGRCVTYNHPEDQQGTRVWTRFTATADGGRWVGALNGQRFELRTRAAPGCSDGMSDRRYPIAVELLVNGERRSGCAEPA